jgi:hypothetical protein
MSAVLIGFEHVEKPKEVHEMMEFKITSELKKKICTSLSHHSPVKINTILAVADAKVANSGDDFVPIQVRQNAHSRAEKSGIVFA